MRRGNGGIIGPRKAPTTSSGSGVWSIQESQVAQGSAIWPYVVPGAPTIGTATQTGSSSATVTFAAPSSNGGSTITSYTAVSSPGGITGTLSQAGSGTITVSGLTGSTNYTFTVYATNGAGNSGSSSASNQITTQALGITVEYLVVAGGGGGGRYFGGGGAGGGLLTGTISAPLSTALSITVGSGGAAGIDGNWGGKSGSSSTFYTVTSTFGGGGGGSEGGSIQYGLNGGSGGGGSGDWDRGGTYYTPGVGIYPGSTYVNAARQGYNGGNGIKVGDYSGGGGGGAGGAGAVGYTTAIGQGNGGVGAASSIIGTSVTYAGGGGGGARDTRGAGGAGGGGGGNSVLNGTTNLGGGGAGGNQNGATAGQGGSGVVIIAYPNTSPAPASISGGLTYDQPTRSGYRVYRFTAGTGTITW